MSLAIFDLDNTLIAGDSDNLWGEFVCEQSLVNSADYSQKNEQFYEDYKAGELDIDAYLRLSLSPLAGQSPETLSGWHEKFMRDKIEPLFLPKAAQLIASHRERNDTLLIITATNRFIAEPIARALGIDEVLACEGEIVDGRYTGEPAGIPSFHEGKVVRLHQWLEGRDIDLTDSWFYSDSHNDLPLLEIVDRPVAVDPDDTLRARAEEMGWQILSLR